MTIVGSVASAWLQSASPGDVPKTTGSFSVSVGDLLVACVDGDNTVTIADSQSGSWSTAVSINSNTDKIFYRMITSAASITVTYGGGTLFVAGTVLKFTGAKSTIGTTGSGSSATNNLTASIFTSTVDNSFAVVFGIESNDLGAASSSDLTINQVNANVGYQLVSGYKSLDTAGAETANLDASGTGTAAWTWAAAEILQAAGAQVLQRSYPNRIWRGRRR